MYTVVQKVGLPILDDYNSLLGCLEIGYIYRETLLVPFYHTNEEYCCSYIINPHNYNHKVTKETCSVCYGSESLMQKG